MDVGNREELDLSDMVDRLGAEYRYWRQQAHVEAEIYIAQMHWCLAAAKLKSDNPNDPGIELYNFLEEAGAILCPYKIYAMFSCLFIEEHRPEGRSLVIRRDRRFYDADQWLLLTQSTDFRFSPFRNGAGQIEDANFHVNALTGFDVSINPKTLATLAGRSSRRTGDKICDLPSLPSAPGQLNRAYWVRSCKPSFSDQPEYFTGVTNDDGLIQLYVPELSSRP